MSLTTNASEPHLKPRHLQGTPARDADRPVSQGTNAVRGTWCSAGAAGRHLRTQAGQANILAGHGTPSPAPIPQRLERIATQAQLSPDMACTTLAHHVDPAVLAYALWRLNPRSAPGVDRVTWRRYKDNLQGNLDTLHEQLVDDTNHPQPAVRCLIPKAHGTRRPLGLPALEGTIVAKAVTLLLEAIYEQDFCNTSDGFRPGRNPHQALHDVRQGLLRRGIRQVIDCDISSFFDNVHHDRLFVIRRKRIKDGRVLGWIETWLKAGILDGKELVFPEQGSPQGAVISPL